MNLFHFLLYSHFSRPLIHSLITQCTYSPTHSLSLSLSLSLFLFLSLSVLSYLADKTIPDMSVVSGTPANFTCNFIKQDTDFTILWTIDGTEIACNAMRTDSNVQCTTLNDEEESVLEIENTILLGVGRHDVQCVMRHMITDEYRNDESFRVGDNFTATAMLEILQRELKCVLCVCVCVCVYV